MTEDRTLVAVLDTNVLVSGLNFPGNERAVMELGRRGRIEVCVSRFIINELILVLERKFSYSSRQCAQQVDALCEWARLIEPSTPPVSASRDPADNPILECCLECRADYLVTGDRRDLLPLGNFRGTVIVNAAAFLRIFESSSNDP